MLDRTCVEACIEQVDLFCLNLMSFHLASRDILVCGACSLNNKQNRSNHERLRVEWGGGGYSFSPLVSLAFTFLTQAWEQRRKDKGTHGPPPLLGRNCRRRRRSDKPPSPPPLPSFLPSSPFLFVPLPSLQTCVSPPPPFFFFFFTREKALHPPPHRPCRYTRGFSALCFYNMPA